MRSVLVFCAVILLAACNDTTGPDAVVNQPFQLKIGMTATLPDEARLRFDNVRSDSRCPIDANCITAGDAIIAVTVLRGGGNDPHEVHANPPQSQFSYANYVIKLTELQPYPRSDRQTKPEDYTATFVVETQ